MKANPNMESARLVASVVSESIVHFASYHELADVPVTFKSLEDEFRSRLALVEDLHKRFHFMMGELKSAGLRVDD